MANLFRIVFDIGKDASSATFCRLVSDLQAIAQAGHDLAIYRAETEADKRLALLARESGWQGILKEARLRQVPAAFSENDSAVFDKQPPDPVTVHPAVFPFMGPYLLALESSYEPWVRLANQLRSLELKELLASLPYEPYRFRSVRYDGVFLVEIVSGHGMAARALGDLLDLSRQYQHERITDKADGEGLTFHRMELRALACQQLPEVGLALAAGVARDLFSDGLLDAMIRLASQEVMVECSTLA